MTNRIVNYSSSLGPLIGNLLVATPSNLDSSSAGSVSWIVYQDDSQVRGIVLNRRVELVADPNFSEPAPEAIGLLLNSSLHIGGPHAGPVVAIHQEPDLADLSSSNGLCIAADQSKITQLLKRQPDRIRLIAGYSTWPVDALIHDLRIGKWFVLPASPELVFASDRELWHRCIRILGRALIQEATGTQHLPPSPWVN